MLKTNTDGHGVARANERTNEPALDFQKKHFIGKQKGDDFSIGQPHEAEPVETPWGLSRDNINVEKKKWTLWHEATCYYLQSTRSF